MLCRRSSTVNPILIGFSIHVWSTRASSEVARRVKRMRPETLIVLAGLPRGRLVRFAGLHRQARVRCRGQRRRRGDLSEIAARLPALTRQGLSTSAGIYMPPGAAGWIHTGHRRARRTTSVAISARPDAEPRSVLSRNLPRCPLGCRFLRVGREGDLAIGLSTDYIAREADVRGIGLTPPCFCSMRA